MKVSILAACCMLLAATAYAQEADSAVGTTPKITSVSKITTKQHQTITIMGSGFGTHHPYTGNTNFISLRDLSKHPIWEAGYKPDADTVTLIVDKWVDTEIVLGGFAGKWGTSNFTLAKGDVEWVRVWNAQTGKGPAAKKVTVSGAATTVASSRNPSGYGELVTFTAAVDSGAHDGETVLFMNGTTELGTGILRGGSASFTTSALEAGSNSIRAMYGDDDSVSLTQTVK
jgi:hypothetical protein